MGINQSYYQSYHLVHANLALMREPLDHAIMQPFVRQIDEINQLARSSEGFISQPSLSDSGDVYKGDLLLNVSCWESVESLKAFTFNGKHAKALGERFLWFKKQSRPSYVLFWFQAGEALTERVIEERIDYLDQHGPTAYAFNFSKVFTSSEAGAYRHERV